MTLDTEPTLRLPIVDVPSAVITTELHIARARANSDRRARIQRRWDLLARILSCLLFGGTIGLLIGICGALFALALSLADQDGAVPALDSTTSTAAALTLPSMPPTAYPLLGGVALDTTTTRPATAPATQRPTTTATTASAPAPAPTPTTAGTLPATTAAGTTAASPPPVTEPATTTSTLATTTAPPPPPSEPSTSPTSTTAAPPASA